MEKMFEELRNKIEEAQSIIIFSHVNADGDTIGSNLALNLIIEKYFNKRVTSVYAGKFPSVYSYLPEYNRMKNIDEIDKNTIYDLAIAVDVAAKDRMMEGVSLFDRAQFKVNIDHHHTNKGYGDINIIEGDASCVGIILYDIFKAWNFEISFDIAKCLYTSVMTDTGNFKYENTTPEVLNFAADLVKIGVSPSTEYRACYETKPQNMVQFQAYVVSNAIFTESGKIAIAKITKEDMAKFNATDDFTEGIVEVLRSSKDVEISAVMKENSDGNTKVSLRSKHIDLTPIVVDFNGGGHNFAAGCTIKKPVSIAFDKLLDRIKSELK
ncbi:bifunctional oligoribonuclease/PAP phosphatase NrnA [bacterium]|nr:bifunctional oligoribonuclease/PAP phosphatase NrnA [bacterium]